MRALLFLTILLCLSYTSLAWYGKHLKNCSNSTCVYYYSQCLNITTCNTSLACINGCARRDYDCAAACYAPVLHLSQFWALQFCNSDCVASSVRKHKKKNDKLLTCMNTCNTEPCDSDIDCLDAFGCMQLCANEDYNCLGQCARWDSEDSNFITLAGCVTLCSNL